MEKLTWGMIGAGDVTELKNGPGLYENDNCQLKAITNRTYEKAVDWSERHNGCLVYRTVDELLADDDIDMVYIATTPDVHKEMALACINAGKHVYIEKPLFKTYEDAEEVLAAAKEKGVFAYVAHYRRGLEPYRKAKELVESGAIGTPLTARITFTCPADTVNGWRADPTVSGGGHFFEGDIHVMDALDMILGPYETVDLQVIPMPENPELEGAVSACFRWKNGMVGSGMWCYDSDADRDTIEIFGTEGSLCLGGLDIPHPLVLTKGSEVTEIPFTVPKSVGAPHERLIAEAVLAGKENPELCTLENAMRTLKTTCRAMKLLREGK